MVRIAILGAGNVGGALGKHLSTLGHEITYGSREPNSDKIQELVKHSPKSKATTSKDAVQHADVVVISTPWAATEALIKSVGNLSGKIVIDATNPIAPGLTLAIGHSTSGGEQVAAWAVGAKVVKAFNTFGYNHIAKPVHDGIHLDLHIAGDDAEAKKVVAGLGKEMGFAPLDVGKLTQARYTEPLAMLWITLAYQQGQGRDHFFKYVPEATNKQ